MAVWLNREPDLGAFSPRMSRAAFSNKAVGLVFVIRELCKSGVHLWYSEMTELDTFGRRWWSDGGG